MNFEDLSPADRDCIIEKLAKGYVLPDDCREAVCEAIQKYANSSLTEANIEKYITSPISAFEAAQHFSGANCCAFSHFKGKLDEYLACLEYNAVKNKGNVVFSFVNPDPHSKADILHVVRVDANYGDVSECTYMVVPGPDVKTGSPTYILDQYEKCCKTKYEIPFFDFDGWITDDAFIRKLTPSQKKRLDGLLAEYPNKKPLKCSFSQASSKRIELDFLKYIRFGELPSVCDISGYQLDYGNADTREIIKKNSIEMSRQVSLDTWDNFSYSVAQSMDNAIIIDKTNRSINTDELIDEGQVNSSRTAEEPVVLQNKAIRTSVKSDTKSAAHKSRRSVANIARQVKSAVVGFAESHPKTVAGIKFFGVVALTTIAEVVSNNTHHQPLKSTDYESAYDNDSDYSFHSEEDSVDTMDESSGISNAEGNHTPKAAHETASYTRIRNGREEKVQGYKTGSKREE
jgi:hypothetical protein